MQNQIYANSFFYFKWSYCFTLDAMFFFFFHVKLFKVYFYATSCCAKANLCSAAKPSDFTPALPRWSCCRHSWPVSVLCAEFMFAMSQLVRTICALEIKRTTLLCHWATARRSQQMVLRSHRASLTQEQNTGEEFKTLFHPVSLNITSTQYTGGWGGRTKQNPTTWCHFCTVLLQKDFLYFVYP